MTDHRDEGLPHLTPETVEDYFRVGVEAALTMDTELRARLEIDPQHQQIRLMCPALGADPDLASYEHIDVERINVLGEHGDWFRLTIDATAMHYEAYVLVESIVDQLRDGASFRHAVSESLSGLKSLLSSRRRMTEEKEAGLIGELLVLRHVIDVDGEDAAILAWLGPLAEEHDFGFAAYDAEVKTTRSESRMHVIGTEYQLQPSPGRPLMLVSIQITRAGQAAEGFRLTELIDDVRARLERTRRTFDTALTRLGWTDGDADLYSTRHMIRSTPRVYIVDDAFPAVTGARLDDVVPQRLLVSGVSYRVDVSHLPHAVPQPPLSAFCEEPK